MFQSTTLPLRTHFYGILLSSNCHASPPIFTLSRHLGISPTASQMFARKLRQRLTMIENEHPLGGPGRIVHVDIQKARRLTRVGARGKGSAKVVLLGDAHRCGFIVVPRGGATSIVRAISQRIAKGSLVFASDEAIQRRLDFGLMDEFDLIDEIDTDTEEKIAAINTSATCFWRAQRVFRENYKHVSVSYLGDYLGEQAFRYNHRTQKLFWPMIEKLCDHASGASPRRLD